MDPSNDASAIRRLIADRDFFVAFQPVVDLATHKIFAHEALVRTKAKAFDGPPSMFEAAVREGCTGELGRAIRERAIDDCTTHPLFLNIHPNELDERWLVQPDDPVSRHPGDVYLEITEGVPLTHFRLCQGILRELRGRGVYLVVDDLGAGYSNLKYIADLHPAFVKLDRELIMGLTTESRLHKLVSAIVVLCAALGAKVVAEGIETEDELHAVIDSGAQYGQGYLLARPSFPPPQVNWPAKKTR